MYSLPDYGKMLADKTRVDAYGMALKQAVTHDSVVLEIGSGTGAFAMEACRLGARKVYAVETNEVIQHAIHFAKENECADRIQFIHNDSTRVELPEQVDVIISDLRGKLPLHGHHLPVIIDARSRFLSAAGILIPRKDILWAALSSAPDLYQENLGVWDPYHAGLNTACLETSITNQIWWKAAKKNERFITEPATWLIIDYHTIASPNVAGKVSWQIQASNIAHGARVWFDAVLIDDIGFSNHPDQPEHIYGNVFFPWKQPVALEAGDVVHMAFQANLVADDYIWRWNTRVFKKQKTGKMKVNFEQSTFFASPFSSEILRRRSADYTPDLCQNGQVDLEILKMMSEGSSLKEIACHIVEHFPQYFANINQALAHVGELSVKYSK